jgi:TonB family protein
MRVQAIKKPKPSSDGCNFGVGMTKVQAVFRKNGKITNIRIVEESDCPSFNKNVLKSVSKIKFIPATKNGQPVSVLMFIEFVYQVE